MIVCFVLPHSLSPQKCPVPKQPALGVHGSSLHSTSPPTSSGGASSERGQQPSSAEVELSGEGWRGEGSTHGVVTHVSCIDHGITIADHRGGEKRWMKVEVQ